MQIGAAILAGGQSRRMGRDKARLLLDAVSARRVPLEGTAFPDRWLANINTPENLQKLLEQR